MLGKKQEEYTTNIANNDDIPYLKTKLLDVNMRLFHSCLQYKALVLKACEHIEECALHKADNYSHPYGFSGANAGIPWNIIAIVLNRGKSWASATVMINPVITQYTGEEVEATSNCGSVLAAKAIHVRRNSVVHVVWYDEDGCRCEGHFGRHSGGFTIQHEVDHNNGVLITDRRIKDAC